MTTREIRRLQQLLEKLNLREAREARGVSALEIAEKLDCSRQNVLALEAKNIQMSSLKAYLTALREIAA